MEGLGYEGSIASSRALVVVWERQAKARLRDSSNTISCGNFLSVSFVFCSHQFKSRSHPQRVHWLLQAFRQPRDFLQAPPVGRPLVDHE